MGVCEDTVRGRIRPLIERGILVPAKLLRVNLAGVPQRVLGYRFAEHPKETEKDRRKK